MALNPSGVCCISLRRGTIIIAVLFNLGLIFLLGIDIFAAVYGNFLSKDEYFPAIGYYGLSLIVTTINVKGEPVLIDGATDHYFTAKVRIPFELLVAAIQIVFLYGVIKKVPNLFLPWLILCISFTVVGFFGIVLIMVVDPFALISLLEVLIDCYLLTVVWYYYQELKHTQKLEKLNTPVVPQEICISKFPSFNKEIIA